VAGTSRRIPRQPGRMLRRRRLRTGRSQETRCHSSAVMREATKISGRH
jgi:hypothetical protein